MASIFKKDDNFVDKPNRNTFDLSFQNNLSLKFGKLIPCMCQEVLPGDSFQCKPTFGLRYLPQVFPVQTRMRAHLHFFYVRNRTIWKDWMDFIGKTKENLVLPYITVDNEKDFAESSIFDYMGLPTSIESSSRIDTLFSSVGDDKFINIRGNQIYDNESLGTSFINFSSAAYTNRGDFASSAFDVDSQYGARVRLFEKPIKLSDKNYPNVNTFKVSLSDPAFEDDTHRTYLIVRMHSLSDPNRSIFGYHSLINSFASVTNVNVFNDFITSFGPEGSETDNFVIDEAIGYAVLSSTGTVSLDVFNNISLSISVIPLFNRNYPLSGINKLNFPYGDNPLQMRISALPFRAYEAVYNSFYRNSENNPFKINGVPEYNRYVKSIDGGSQPSSDFKLFNRNWEDDAFTTAVPTPQQGNAPLVGLTGNPNEPLALRVYDQDGNISTVNLVANENGQITVAEGFSGETNTIVNALNDAVNFGITINDLRNVNSLQLWLEKNVRKGYKYRDQMLSHYGVAIDYDDLMIPEFIGGVSRDVTVNQISQTVETSDGNLGDMAGQAYVVGDGEHIRKYCPEHGYIIGIVSVVPVPNYSQMIPKHFFKHDTFDYFFPEFGKIGMQPIMNKEIASLASWIEHSSDETFGYQRAWYDYLANVDQVHGKFNGDFYNFLLQRKFDEVPELGESFTTVINEDLNNIFYTESDEDKILGQIYFDIKAIRPIPLFGIPSLE